MPFHHRWSLMIMAAIRIFIACLIGYSGVLWLLSTQSVSELLLNAVALAYVFDFDELMFLGAAPDAMRSFVSQLRPLPIRRSGRFGFLRHSFSLSFLGVVIMFVLVVIVYVPSEMSFRQDALDALCKGFTDFVYAIDNSGMPYWYESSPVSKKSWDTTLREQTLSITRDPDSQAWNRLYVLRGSLLSLETVVGQSLAESVSRFNDNCANVFHPSYELSSTGSQRHGPILLNLMRETLQDTTFNDCATLGTSVCDDFTIVGARARQFCSEQCGCRSAISRNGNAVVDRGCPLACPLLPTYYDNPHILNCTQLSDAELIANPAWIAFVGGMASNMQLLFSRAGETNETIEANSDAKISFAIVTLLSTAGCGGLATSRNIIGEVAWNVNINLCDGTGLLNMFKPLAIWCPVICECTTKWRSGCPSSCDPSGAPISRP